RRHVDRAAEAGDGVAELILGGDLDVEAGAGGLAGDRAAARVRDGEVMEGARVDGDGGGVSDRGAGDRAGQVGAAARAGAEGGAVRTVAVVDDRGERAEVGGEGDGGAAGAEVVPVLVLRPHGDRGRAAGGERAGRGGDRRVGRRDRAGI